MSRERPFVLCLTGGVASGKTAVSDFWGSWGWQVIDTDVIAREVVAPDSHGLKQLVTSFGDAILRADGGLNRREMRQLVFNNEVKRQQLNDIIHPLIKNQVVKQINQATAHLLLLVVPLYSPDISYHFIDRVCVVDAKESDQLKRLMGRDGVNKDLAERMLQAQPKRNDRIRWADDVVVNHGSLAALKTNCHLMFASYNSWLNTDNLLVSAKN